MTLMDIAPYLVVVFIVFINIALWSSLRSRGTQQHFDLWRKAGSSLQKPWAKEEKNLQELADRVKNLRQGSREQISTEKDLMQEDENVKERKFDN
jgi:hypothetical protein